MSVSYYAHAIIGLGLPSEAWREALAPKPKFRDDPGCNCNKAKTGFCSKCGKPLKISVQTNEKECENFYLGEVLEELPAMIKLPNIRLGVGADSKFYCIGVGPDKVGGWGKDDEALLPADHLDLNKIRTALKDKFEPMGLWDEKAFGLWVIQYVS